MRLIARTVRVIGLNTNLFVACLEEHLVKRERKDALDGGIVDLLERSDLRVGFCSIRL